MKLLTLEERQARFDAKLAELSKKTGYADFNECMKAAFPQEELDELVKETVLEDSPFLRLINGK